jgi:hypothetical protein
MAEITAAIDEQGAKKLFDTAVAAIGTQTKSGSGNLGPSRVRSAMAALI